MKLRKYTHREFSKILEDNGFVLDHISGSHYIYKRNHQHLSINLKPNPCVCQRLIKEYNLKIKN